MHETSLEIAIFNVGTHTLEDETTEDGKMWHGLFKRLTQVPGFVRAGWGRVVDDLSTNIFLVGTYIFQSNHKFPSVGRKLRDVN